MTLSATNKQSKEAMLYIGTFPCMNVTCFSPDAVSETLSTFVKRCKIQYHMAFLKDLKVRNRNCSVTNPVLMYIVFHSLPSNIFKLFAVLCVSDKQGSG